MQCFSVFDLLLMKNRERDQELDDMYLFFRKRGIKKIMLTDLQQTAYYPSNPEFRLAIEDYLGMSELEIELALGHIPSKYRESYFQNISTIASLLQPKEKLNVEKYKPYYESCYGTLYNGDCIRVLNNIPDGSVDLVFADPPFNLGKTYDPGVEDSLTISNYLNWTFEWVDECVRILKPGGRIFVYNLPKWCVYIAEHLSEQLTFFDWIAVDMKFSLPIQNRLYPAHYALVSFIKGVKANTYNNQRVPMQICRHCGGEIKDYGGYKAKMNPEGINVSDVWNDIYPVRHKSSKNRKFNELSVKLLDRIISMSTNEGDIVFDPFGGSGTTYAVAQLLNRKWIGCELGDCEIIKQRLLHPERDKAQLQKVYEEKGCLFTSEATEIRKKNGFWTCDTFSGNSAEKRSVEDAIQISLNLPSQDK